MPDKKKSNAAPTPIITGTSSFATVTKHPELLLRRTQPDPKHIWTRSVDVPDDRFVFRRCSGSKRRGVAPDNRKVRVELAQAVAEPLGDAIGAAKVVVPSLIEPTRCS